MKSVQPSKLSRPSSPGAIRAAQADAPCGSAAENSSAPDPVDLHAIWTSKSLFRPATNRDRHFQSQLVTNYLQIVDAMHGAPPNVNAHLWTDRKDNQFLRISFAGPNGTEIEIPHSMLDSPKLRVSVHPQKELQTMVDKAPEPLRKTMREIHTHSANENVGLRSDVIRQIVTTLYRRPGAETDMALNVYADCDTIRDMVTQRHISVLTKARKEAENARSGSDAGPPRLPDIVEEPKSGTLQHAKLTALALHLSLESAQRTTCTIPKPIQATGFANYLKENDVIAAIPGSEAALAVAQSIEARISNFSSGDPESVPDEALKKEIAQYEQVVRETMHDLSAWIGGVAEPLHGPSPTPTPEQILKMFHLAQQVLNIRPKLQEQIDQLDEKAKAIDKTTARVCGHTATRVC